MIYSVIVTFNPNHDNLNALVDSLIKKKVIPVVVDNASASPITVPCRVINLDANYGIAKAQNVGIDYVLKNNSDAIIFFDQDSSIVDDEFISKLYEPILNNRSKISAPVFVDNARGFTYPIVEIKKFGGRVKHYPSFEANEFIVNNVISSGTMVEVKALKEIGFMLEDLFIDYVDTEWCLRAHRKGFDVLVVPSARMIHSIGDTTLKIGCFYIPKHSPFRRYYRIRNSFYLLRLTYIPKFMAIREVVFSMIHQLVLIIFSKKERFQYLDSLVRGISDGVMGRFK